MTHFEKLFSALLIGLAMLSATALAIMAFEVRHARAEPATFIHGGLAKDGERYETYLKSHWKPGRQSPAQLIAAGSKAMGKDAREAARNYAMAAVGQPANAEGWIGLAQALLAIEPDPNKGSERYDLPVNASGAAYLAQERASNKAQRARALAVLSQALKRRAFWRPAIESLKASLMLVSDTETQAELDRLMAEHGFRMTDYRTDSEAASPRVCLQFSEELARGSVDFSKYVSVGGQDPSGVTAENKQLCIEGLKHGERYEIQLKAGLPSSVGESLSKSIDVALYVPDRKPAVRFTGRAYVLPSRGQQGIPLVSINTSAVAIEIYRVGDRNLAQTLQNGDLARQLSTWDVETIQNRNGEKIYAGELPVTQKLNAEVTTAVPVGDAVGALKPGAYVMIAKPVHKTGNNDSQIASQWFIVSDLGLTAFTGNDGLHAFVRSLADTKPISNAKVRLVARNNEVLAEAETDAKGYARFAANLAKGEGGLAPAILIAEKAGGVEYAFLDLTSAAFDLSDRGVKGRDAPGAIDAYIYTERGVYRPGETVHLAGIVRDGAGKAVTTPMTLIVTRPDGVTHRSLVLTDKGLGGRTTELHLTSASQTGTWRARLHADPTADAIAQVSFLVEDFAPERLDMTLTAPDKPLQPEQTQSIKVAGKYLYGPPAAGLGLEGDIIVRPAAGGIAGFEGYHFGLADEQINPVRQPLENLVDTGADGNADVPVLLPAIPDTARPLEAQVLVRLKEPGGRSIERSVTMPVMAPRQRIGIKPLFKSQDLGEESGKDASFELIHLDRDTKRSAVNGAKWQLMRLETSWQWYARDGVWTYEAVTFTRKAASGSIDIGADKPASITAPVGYGRYRLEVTTDGTDAAASSYAFSAGWFVSGDDPDSPEVLDVALDKPTYAAGETAKLRIASKYAGTALVAVLGSDLHEMREVAVEKGDTEVALTVSQTWGAGAYVTVLMYRPMDEALKRMPGRSLGLAWLGLDPAPRTLTISLDAPEKVKSGSTLAVPVALGGLPAGEEARVTVAAVDVGVLNVTRFKTPAPQSWFYQQRKLGTEIRDFYGRLIDGMRAERGTLRSGGDGGGPEMQGAPPTEDILSLFSGIVTVGADGKATVSFEMPDFNGSVRLMAVAWSGDKVGSADKTVIVRDEIAVTMTTPRFLTLGDEARLTLDLHNVEGPAALYQLSVDRSRAETEGTPKERVTDKTIDLKTGARLVERIALKPADVGLFAYDVRIAGPGGIDVKRRVRLDVKPPAGDIKRTTVAKIAPKGSLTLSKDLVADLIASRTRINLSAGPQARFDVPGLLTSLDRYPYGCAEQTVSRALPLVYANAIASRIGIDTDKALKERVQKAIDHVFAMQDSSGAFGIWGPSEPDLWLTAYVADFLTRTREAGFEVRAEAFTQALDRLQNFISYAQDFEKGGEDRAYALYVLARNSRAPIGELRYYVDARLDRFSTPLAKAQLGAALAMMGDKTRAERAFAAAVAALDAQGADISRGDYGSGLRDGAALVTLASETGIAKAEAPRLVDVIAKAYAARGYTSTQEQAWLLLAANALSDEATAARLILDGAPLQAPIFRPLTPAEISKDGGLKLANDGDAAIEVVVSVIGASLTPEPAASKGFTVKRSYYTLDGRQVDLASGAGGKATLTQNERLVAVLTVETREAGGRVLLVDRLPAGLEIENPRLVQSGDIKSLGWLAGTVSPEHTEFRDDRFVASFNLFNSQQQNGTEGTGGDATKTEAPLRTASAAYIVRAVTPGTFVHPAATVEDMYRPDRYARSAAGTLTISGKE